jgi:hypothetical protein
LTGNDINPALLLQAIVSRQTKRFVLEDYCFPEQLDFIKDPARFKTAVCSRRSGKTIACAADLIDTALRFPKSKNLYITLSRANAKRILWPELLNINEQYKLMAHTNETELSMAFINGSIIYLSGAKDKTEIEKFRGLALKKVYIDECQSFRAYIQNLVDEVLSKALFDYAGTLCLIGTPGPVPAGYFYEASQAPTWSHHAWTFFQNPHIAIKSGQTHEQVLQDDLNRTGLTLEDATIQREVFGRWVTDSNSLVFKYNPVINHYARTPDVDGTWKFVIGVDIGYDDADAIAVIGWNDKIKESYLIEEYVLEKSDITTLANEIESRIKKYKPLKVVMDTGGLGKKIAEELQRRRSLPIKAAEKQRKVEFIELLNDAMRTKRFMAKKDSQFADDCFKVEWEEGKKFEKISDKFHSDITDAVLYAFRESLHWLYKPEPVKLKAGTDEWYKAEEKRMEQLAEEALREKKEMDYFEDMGWNV